MSNEKNIYDSNNVFARILNKELETEIIYENDQAIVIKDKYPDAPFHHLVLCKGKYIDFRIFCNEASDEEKLAFVAAIGNELNKISGGAKVLFNIGKDGGQEVFHLHAHVLGGEGIKRAYQTCDLASVFKDNVD